MFHINMRWFFLCSMVILVNIRIPNKFYLNIVTNIYLYQPWYAANIHDDVIKWKHFPHYWPFVRGIHRSPVISPHKGQWRGALMFSLICVWINGWVNNREAGDLRRYRAHYDVTVMLRQKVSRSSDTPWRKSWNVKQTVSWSRVLFSINAFPPGQDGRHFQMHFLEWKWYNSDSNFTEMCSQESNWQ